MSIRDLVDKNRNRSEGFQIIESFIVEIFKILRDIPLNKVDENIQVVVDKLMIEIGKSKKTKYF